MQQLIRPTPSPTHTETHACTEHDKPYAHTTRRGTNPHPTAKLYGHTEEHKGRRTRGQADKLFSDTFEQGLHICRTSSCPASLSTDSAVPPRFDQTDGRHNDGVSNAHIVVQGLAASHKQLAWHGTRRLNPTWPRT
jgi:hypothetical protein